MFRRRGHAVESIVAEVRNTPWDERHCYVLADRRETGGAAALRFAKAFHVSPFMPMDVRYDWRVRGARRRLGVNMT